MNQERSERVRRKGSRHKKPGTRHRELGASNKKSKLEQDPKKEAQSKRIVHEYLHSIGFGRYNQYQHMRKLIFGKR